MRNLWVLIICVLFFLNGCSRGITSTAFPAIEATKNIHTPTPMKTQEPEFPPTPDKTDPIIKGISVLSEWLHVPEDQISHLDIEPALWINSCMGASLPQEICAEIVTSGEIYTYKINDELFKVHISLDGQQIRVPGMPGKSVPDAVELARAIFAKDNRVPRQAVLIIGYEQKDWPDACLGLHEPETVCAMVITSGYSVSVILDNKMSVLRTNLDGSQIIPELGADSTGLYTPLLIYDWSSPDCNTFMFSDVQISRGPCHKELSSSEYPNLLLLDQLKYLTRIFAPVDISIDDGVVRFIGVGTQIPDEIDQENIVNWVKRAVSLFDDPGTELGLLISFNRSGGIAGSCYNGWVYNSGWMELNNCSTGKSQWLYSPRSIGVWAKVSADENASSTYTFPTQPFPDQFVYKITFFGKGSNIPSPDVLTLAAVRIEQLINYFH